MLNAKCQTDGCCRCGQLQEKLEQEGERRQKDQQGKQAASCRNQQASGKPQRRMRDTCRSTQQKIVDIEALQQQNVQINRLHVITSVSKYTRDDLRFLSDMQSWKLKSFGCGRKGIVKIAVCIDVRQENVV